MRFCRAGIDRSITRRARGSRLVIECQGDLRHQCPAPRSRGAAHQRTAGTIAAGGGGRTSRYRADRRKSTKGTSGPRDCGVSPCPPVSPARSSRGAIEKSTVAL